MDTPAVNQLISDLNNWGGSLYFTHGWRLPYWEEADWRQYAVEWGLRVLKHYGTDLATGHAFSLIRTCVYRDLADVTKSVVPDGKVAIEDHEPVQEDVAWIHCIPSGAQEFLKRILELPLEAWDAAEAAWKAMGRKKLTTSVDGLSFLTSLPQNQVRASIVLLQHHLSLN